MNILVVVAFLGLLGGAAGQGLPQLQQNGFQQLPVYNYDPFSTSGPMNWAFLDIPLNECGGRSNSPIDIQTKDTCDVNAQYSLIVSYACFVLQCV